MLEITFIPELLQSAKPTYSKSLSFDFQICSHKSSRALRSLLFPRSLFVFAPLLFSFSFFFCLILPLAAPSTHQSTHLKDQRENHVLAFLFFFFQDSMVLWDTASWRM